MIRISGQMKGRTMNPLIQLNRQLQHLFIALLFACFAIAQSAQAVSPEPNEGDLIGNMAEEDDSVAELGTATENAAAAQSTPRQIGHNKWVIPIDFTKPLQCAGGNVIVHANLVVTFKNVPDLGVVRHELKLEGFRGTATNGSRKLEPNPKDLRFLPYVKVDPTNGGPAFGFEFIVTGPGFQKGVAPLRFNVKYNPNRYKFKDGKVTHLIADGTPLVRCRK
jgi:hypothetical protein